MSDDEEVATLAAHYLKLIFKARGLTPLKVEILLPAHSLDTVRASYRAWLYDHAVHEEGEYNQPTLRREEGIAHFFREGEINLGSRPVFRPKVGGKWEHEYNAVTDIVVREVNDPDVDEDVASQWKRVEEMLSLGLGPDELTD
jgi:hypothetical protein